MGYEELKIEGRNAVLEAFRSGKTIDKFLVGPTPSRPGPILFKVEATAVKFVVRLKLSTLIKRVETSRMKK